MRSSLLCGLLLASAIGAQAQDDLVRVKSPNGQIEFQLFIATPEPGSLPRLAYQVFFQGKRLVDPSYLGMNIHNQEPFLGEKLGLTSSKLSGSSLTAEYMQNGSLGRLLNIEVRAFDDGVAFRYVVPWSAPLEEILIDYEATEFRLARAMPLETKIDLPFVIEQPGVGWMGIAETHLKDYPPMYLERTNGRVLNSRLIPPADPSKLAFEGKTPMTSSWRVLSIGASRAAVLDSKIVDRLP